jgi:hypothetical protein
VKTKILIGSVALLTSTLLAADAKDDVTKAAKKLADAGSYSWKSTAETAGGGGGGGMRPGPTEGKIAKDGTVHLQMTRGENTVEAVLKGEKGAVKTQEGWQSLTELTSAEGDQAPRGRFMGRMLQNFRAPAVEAADMLSKVKELKKDGDVYSGDLTEDGVKALLTRGFRPGGNAPEMGNPKGWIKLWVKDGLLTRYQYNVQATMTFQGNERNIDRTTNVEIKDVGATNVEVPEEAKKKLS